MHRTFCLRTGIVLLVLRLAIEPSFGASLDKRYTHFTLKSASLEELEGELIRRGPRLDGSGKGHAGATRVEIKATVGYDERDRVCRIGKADVAVHARVTLPRWKPRKSPRDEERLLWTILLADIKRHEERHVGIALNHARELERLLRGLDRSRDCRSLSRRVEQLTNRILARHEEAQRRFDRIEGINFESRLDRLLKYRLQQIEKSTAFR